MNATILNLLKRNLPIIMILSSSKGYSAIIRRRYPTHAKKDLKTKIIAVIMDEKKKYKLICAHKIHHGCEVDILSALN